jgi:hypothetical protein
MYIQNLYLYLGIAMYCLLILLCLYLAYKNIVMSYEIDQLRHLLDKHVQEIKRLIQVAQNSSEDHVSSPKLNDQVQVKIIEKSSWLTPKNLTIGGVILFIYYFYSGGGDAAVDQILPNLNSLCESSSGSPSPVNNTPISKSSLGTSSESLANETIFPFADHLPDDLEDLANEIIIGK